MAEKAFFDTVELVEPLTRREKEVLGLLAEDLFDREIAERLTLALSSVKTYTHQIYGKLGVEGRREAVAKARRLGLLNPAQEMVSPRFQHNLPRDLTPFIGRTKEVAQLRKVIVDRKYSLITLTGAGGIGKTRLALRLGAELLSAFTDGVCLVELAPLGNPDRVAMTVIQSLGMQDIPASQAEAVLVNYLRDKHLLLILDNCEHLLDECSRLSNLLLKKCSQLQILVTSREILGVPGEKPFRVPSLGTPDPQCLPDLEQVAGFDSIRLFVERAEQSFPEFSLDEANARSVATICRRLDGNPLAIELAAARTRVMATEQIATRLDNLFNLLTGGSRSVLPRQRTLKATIDWSYLLLSEQERLALQRCSVFVGSWTMEAAEAVLAGEGIQPAEVMDLLTSLVDKSLAQTTGVQEDFIRYRILETVRQYAHDRLIENGGGRAERERHLDYYLAFCLQAEEQLIRGKNRRYWAQRLESDMDNLRLAMEWSISGSLMKGLRLASALFGFWNGSGHRIEGFEWLERLLAAEVNDHSAHQSGHLDETMIEQQAARGKALNAAAFLSILIGRDRSGMLAEAQGIFESLGSNYLWDLVFTRHLSENTNLQEDLALARRIDDKWLISEVLGALFPVILREGDLAQAQNIANEHHLLRREIEDVDGEIYARVQLGMLDFLQGNYPRAFELFNSSHADFQKGGNPEFSAHTLRFLAWVAMAQGDYRQAVSYSQAQLAATQEMNIPWVTADAYGFLGWEAWLLQEEKLAFRYCEEAQNLTRNKGHGFISVAPYVLAQIALDHKQYHLASDYLVKFLNHEVFDGPPIQMGIQAFGVLMTAQSDVSLENARQAAVLFGGRGGLHLCLSNIISPLEREEYERAVDTVRQALGVEAFAAAWAEGLAMSTQQAIHYARSLNQEMADREQVP